MNGLHLNKQKDLEMKDRRPRKLKKVLKRRFEKVIIKMEESLFYLRAYSNIVTLGDTIDYVSAEQYLINASPKNWREA